LRLHESVTLGGLLLGLGLLVPLFFGARRFVLWFRLRYAARFGRSRALKYLTNTFLFRGLKWLVVG
jgi:hypothetical protein